MANIVEDLQRGTAAINSIEAALKAKGVIGESEEVPVEEFDNRIEEIGGDASNIFRNSNILCNFSDSELEDIKYILPNEWDETESYIEHDICSKDGVVYQAIATPTLGIFDPEYEWTKVDLVSYLGFLSLVSNIFTNVSIYSQGDRYYIGQYVIHGGRMYRCDADSSIVASTASPDTDYFYMFSYNQFYRDDLLQRSLGSGFPTFDASESYDPGAIVLIDGLPIIFYDGYTANDPSTFYGSYVNTGELIAYLNKKHSSIPLLMNDLYIYEYNETNYYNLYDIVYHNEYYYYLSNGNYAPGPFDENYWTQTFLPNIIEYRIVASEYSNKIGSFGPEDQYYPNDLVFWQDGRVYQFRTAHLGEWDPDDVFIRFSIDDSISQLMHWANLLTIDTTALNTFNPTTSYTAGDVVVNLQGIPVKFINNYTANDISTYSVEFASDVDIAIYLINSQT
jgi:hypothetical protein